jgi:hypothetical protein
MVMEFIESEILQSLTEAHVEKVATILQHFSTITSNVAGSLSDGPSTGLLWPETNDLIVNNLSDIENWFTWFQTRATEVSVAGNDQGSLSAQEKEDSAPPVLSPVTRGLPSPMLSPEISPTEPK